MTKPNIVHGQLSLGSFIKLSLIAAIGVLPVLAVVYGIAVLLGLARSHHSPNPDGMPDYIVWAFVFFQIITSAVSVVLSGLFAGLCGYPFYAWLCRRRRGMVLKGRFDVL